MERHARGHRPLSRAVRGILSLTALLAATAGWAATYRWVDEKGTVHYSDTIPPQYAGQAHSELNSQGRVVRRVEEAARSAEARARQEREKAQEEAEARAEREGLRRDNALMATYASVQDIDKAKARALAQETSLLESLRVLRQHSTSQAETEQIDAMIKTRQTAIATIKAKFDADRARYLELQKGR